MLKNFCIHCMKVQDVEIKYKPLYIGVSLQITCTKCGFKDSQYLFKSKDMIE